MVSGAPARIVAISSERQLRIPGPVPLAVARCSQAEMAHALASDGKIALYGIYFDSSKAEVKPTSEDTLVQIGKLMKENAQMKLLVVGHTDNNGAFSSNIDLSQKRAAAVVKALVERHGVKKDRLTPVGVSFAAPVGSNSTEEGRAKNRRVELVKL